jgi:hypothetical protein
LGDVFCAGGNVGYDKVLWQSVMGSDWEGPSVQFTYQSFDGEQGALFALTTRLHAMRFSKFGFIGP